MGTVLVDVDTLDVFGVDVARNVRALVHDENALAMGFGFVSKNGTVQAGADYEIIIHNFFSLNRGGKGRGCKLFLLHRPGRRHSGWQ